MGILTILDSKEHWLRRAWRKILRLALHVTRRAKTSDRLNLTVYVRMNPRVDLADVTLTTCISTDARINQAVYRPVNLPDAVHLEVR